MNVRKMMSTHHVNDNIGSMWTSGYHVSGAQRRDGCVSQLDACHRKDRI